MTNCPECSAPQAACTTRYHECLVKEFSQAGYGAVHHLTVATYMLQHSSNLTKEGWLYERELLREFLLENKSPAFVRKQSRDIVDDGRRIFKIKSKDGQPVIHKTDWTKTILDVPMDDSESYCTGITEWAMAVLKDAEELKV